MKTKSVKASLTTMCLFIVVVCVAVIGAVSVFNIRSMSNMANSNYENAMSDGYNSEIKSEVQSVISILQSEYDRVQAGDLTEEAAKKEAAEIVRAMRYRDDGSGYFWIDDTDYNLIMHPILPDQEGNNRYDLTDQNGVKIIQEIMKGLAPVQMAAVITNSTLPNPTVLPLHQRLHTPNCLHPGDGSFLPVTM